MAEKTGKFERDPAQPADTKQDRRRSGSGGGGTPKPGAKSLGAIGHDDLGNAVWEWRVDVPARREDDPTIDLLDCLDVEGLSLEDDDDKPESDDFNPYNKKR
jgi:hypothetical protein